MNFKQSLDIIDPITFEQRKEPLKPFMVTQLQIAFERDQMILSPFDEVLHKQLVDYHVEKISSKGDPIFTSKEEHFVDALGLAYLAMVLEFKELTNMMKEPETTTKISHSTRSLIPGDINKMFRDAEGSAVNYGNNIIPQVDKSDLPGDRPTQFKVDVNYRKSIYGTSWGSRATRVRGGMSVSRKTW